MQLPPLILLSLFIISLLVAISASTWFTKRLEVICEIFDLPESLLSLLGALGANIPNYAASIVAIATGQMTTGLGIIVGSNIYNIAIILAISTFATARHEGLVLSPKQAYDARMVALLANPNNANTERIIRDVQEAARAIGVQLQIYKASSIKEIDDAFASIGQRHAGALLAQPRCRTAWSRATGGRPKAPANENDSDDGHDCGAGKDRRSRAGGNR